MAVRIEKAAASRKAACWSSWPASPTQVPRWRARRSLEARLRWRRTAAAHEHAPAYGEGANLGGQTPPGFPGPASAPRHATVPRVPAVRCSKVHGLLVAPRARSDGSDVACAMVVRYPKTAEVRRLAERKSWRSRIPDDRAITRPRARRQSVADPAQPGRDHGIRPSRPDVGSGRRTDRI